MSLRESVVRVFRHYGLVATGVTDPRLQLIGDHRRRHPGQILQCAAVALNEVGAALLDLDKPWKVLHRTHPYLLSPQHPYECVGDVPNVVFPCAALVEGDRLTVYYGGADTVVCLAHGFLSEVLEFVRS